MIYIDLAYLCRPHPKKWFYPLTLLKEDGRNLICVSHLNRIATRQFLRQHRLLELFDDIHYNTPEPSTAFNLSDLPALAVRSWPKTRLTWALTLSDR